jgi:hypothetical protein
MLHNTIFLYFPKQNKVPNMRILSQILKGHNSETICPFELKFLVEMYFNQLYLVSTREVLGIDQSIAIDALSMPALDPPRAEENAMPGAICRLNPLQVVEAFDPRRDFLQHSPQQRDLPHFLFHSLRKAEKGEERRINWRHRTKGTKPRGDLWVNVPLPVDRGREGILKRQIRRNDLPDTMVRTEIIHH